MTSFISPRRVRNSHGDLPVHVACTDEVRLFGSTNITDCIACSHLGAPAHMFTFYSTWQCLPVQCFTCTYACATEIISFHILFGRCGNVPRAVNWERETHKREMSDGGTRGGMSRRNCPDPVQFDKPWPCQQSPFCCSYAVFLHMINVFKPYMHVFVLRSHVYTFCDVDVLFFFLFLRCFHPFYSRPIMCLLVAVNLYSVVCRLAASSYGTCVFPNRLISLSLG